MNNDTNNLIHINEYEIARIQYPRILDNELIQALAWREDTTWYVLSQGDHEPVQWTTIDVGGLVVLAILDQSFMQSVTVGDTLMLCGDGEPYPVDLHETAWKKPMYPYSKGMVFTILYDTWDDRCVYKYVYPNGIVVSEPYNPYKPYPFWLRPMNNEVHYESQ